MNCHFHLFFNVLFRISLNSVVFILPKNRWRVLRVYSGKISCAGKTRSRLPPFQRLIPQTTPKKHLLAADSANYFNKGRYLAEKDIIICMKASYTSLAVFPAVLIGALPLGPMHMVINYRADVRWSSLGKGGGWHRCSNKEQDTQIKKCVSAYIMN